MITLNNQESISYYGGAKITASLAIALAAIGSFIMGFIDGFSNPKACNSR